MSQHQRRMLLNLQELRILFAIYDILPQGGDSQIVLKHLFILFGCLFRLSYEESKIISGKLNEMKFTSGKSLNSLNRI